MKSHMLHLGVERGGGGGGGVSCVLKLGSCS